MVDLQESLSPSSSLSSSSSNFPNPTPLSIGEEIWLIAEQRTQEILFTIQPNVVSEQRRKDIIDYVQRLIRGYYGTEVISFGSVPLKTYLPDGDIDLTALSHQNLEDDIASDVCNILEGEKQDPEFQVKGVQYIHAQVKLVKCIVKNIAVDISFNQIAGLCTLCFLEQVDRLIGKDHLFKRSIILVKAWCYYESRILGALHGLISTYALETLVLCIINRFHSSLNGPLAVLYRFLDYYSTFDWDSYCVSINGPVPISSHPETETPENDGIELLLSKEFLRACKEIFSVQTKAEIGGQEFPIKHLNVVDPLKGNNNLGRSVSKGNFHRIRCALSYGAQKLGEILMLPGESMGEGLGKFFVNTLDRNGRGQRPDVQVPVPAYGTGRSLVSDLSGDYCSHYSNLRFGHWYLKNSLPVPAHPSPLSSPSPSQLQNRSPWDVLRQMMQCNLFVFSRRGTDVFVPRQFCGKSRGTGTYIPDMNRQCRRNMPMWARARIPESAGHDLIPKSPQKSDNVDIPSVTDKEESDHDLIPKSPQKSDHVDIPLETDKEESGSFHGLSLEEFPLLPRTKKPSETRRSGQPKVKSPPAKDSSSPILDSLEFGTFGRSPSLLGLPSAAASKQADSSVLFTMDPTSAVPTLAMQGQELSESDAACLVQANLLKRDAVYLVQPYHLEDSKDFPPLASAIVARKEKL